ncbi:MAG: OmpA family protein [Burkholderiaceae bacterium]
MKMSACKTAVGWACMGALIASVGCATPPPVVQSEPSRPVTTVVLLPDEDGVVGAVLVKTTTGDSRLVSQVFQSVSVMTNSTGLLESRQLDVTQVNRSYAELLKVAPTHPARFTLYFGVGADLLPESQTAIAKIVGTIRSRTPTEVFVIGHTDTTGTDDINGRLALERASIVEKMLKGRMPSLDQVTVRGFGSRDLLVPTGPSVTEPRNRRVEVVVL